MTIVSKVISTDTPGVKPFYRYQAFKPGDAPSNVTCPVSGVYMAVADRYEDGSVKVAEMCGLVDMTAGSVTLPINATTTADTLPGFTPATVTIQFVGLGTATLSFTSNGTLSAAVGSGGVVAWATIKGYTNGDYRVDPWVEVCSTALSKNVQFSYQVVVKIGTTILYDSVTPLVFYSYSTIRLLSGQAFEGYYKNGDPQVYVKEDTEYLRALPMVDVDYVGRATETTDWLSTDHNFGPWYDEDGVNFPTPSLTLAPTNIQQQRLFRADTGYSNSIGPLGQGWAQFVTSSGGRQSFKIAMCNDMALGNYSIHAMDPATGVANSINDHPTLYWFSIADAGQNNPAIYDLQHEPPSAIITYLLTGSQWALRQVQMQAAGDQLFNDYRADAQGICDPGHALISRGQAWVLRDIKFAASISLHGSALRTEFVRQLHNNVDWFNAVFITGVLGQGWWVNNLGYTGRLYNAGAANLAFDAPWMVHFNVITQNQILNSGLLDSGHTTLQIANVRFCNKHPIGMAGDGVASMPYPYCTFYEQDYVSVNYNGGSAPAWFPSWRALATANGVPDAGAATPPGSPIVGPGGIGPRGYMAQLWSALVKAYDFEQVHGATDSSDTAASALNRLVTASNIGDATSQSGFPILFTASANGAAREAIWLMAPKGARWNGAQLILPSVTAPIVTLINASPGDIDSSTPGVQIYVGTTETYTATGVSGAGHALTWQWFYTVGGGARTPLASGSGPTATQLFHYDTSGITYQWIVRFTDTITAEFTEQTLTVNIVDVVVTAPAGAAWNSLTGSTTGNAPRIGATLIRRA